jgi:2-oxoglutarate dehydrogenase complex dehydrogenase (E1) component-like enzyme
MSVKKNWKLGELEDALKKAYSGKIGWEYTHIPHGPELLWLRDRIENGTFEKISPETRAN